MFFCQFAFVNGISYDGNIEITDQTHESRPWAKTEAMIRVLLRIKHASNSWQDGNKYHVRIWKGSSFQIKYGKSNNWVNFRISKSYQNEKNGTAALVRATDYEKYIFGYSWRNTRWNILVYYDSIQRNYHDYDDEIYSCLMNSLSLGLYLAALKKMNWYMPWHMKISVKIRFWN